MIGATEISQARAGTRIAVVTVNEDDAHDVLERVAQLADAGAKVTRSNGQLTIAWPTGGRLRFLRAGHDPRGEEYDLVVVDVDAFTTHPDLAARYLPTLVTTDGDLRIGQV